MHINKHLHFTLLFFFMLIGTIAISDYNFFQMIPYDSGEITIYSFLSMLFVLIFFNPKDKKVKIKS